MTAKTADPMKTAEQMATEIVDALSHLMAMRDYEATTGRKATRETWGTPRQDAIRVITEALERASGQHR